MEESKLGLNGQILTCTDFPGECCDSCHDSTLDEEFPIEVYSKDFKYLFAKVCCLKLIDAETRRDNVVISNEPKLD